MIMGPSKNGRTRSLRLLEELPGVGDVVWTTLTRFAGAQVPTTLILTAAERRAGTTVLSTATAIGLSQHQRIPVCLLETDVRHPALAGYLGLETAGLSDILDGRAELEDCLQKIPECPDLLVVTAGTPRPAVPGELRTDRMTSVLARLEELGRFVVVDAPPVLGHVESRLLLQHADGALLVLRARSTLRSDAERAHAILLESGTPILGAVFNDHRKEGPFGDLGSANRAFQRAVQAVRRRPSPAEALRGREVPFWVDDPPALRPELANGEADPAVPEMSTPITFATEADYRRHIEILERRIAKLTFQLEQTEANLRRIAAMKNIDLGIASIYRTVQGLNLEDEARAVKRTLLRKIFQANMELKTAMARLP